MVCRKIVNLTALTPRNRNFMMKGDKMSMADILKEVQEYFDNQPMLTPDEESLLERINVALDKYPTKGYGKD